MALTDIQAAGWRGTYASPPASFDPVGAPETLNVTRSGFDATGTAAAPVDVVTIMSRVRLPYPDQSTLTANDVSLSDFIYAGDSISGVTNNSTLAAPLPICMWLDHDLQRVTTGTYTAKLAVAHAHARSGRPVAAVKFIATDGSTTVEQLVSSMSSTSYPVSGLTVPHFEADLDLSTLTANALITIDAIIYPWVGAAYKASVHGAPYPSANFCEMKVLNDVSYGTAYAYVDPVSGNDGTGVTSATPATAQASPYLTVENAAKGIETYNAANFSRSNASGGIVRLEVGTSTHEDFSEVVVGEIPLVVEAADPANKVTTTYQHVVDSHRFDSIPDLFKFKDITLMRSTFGRVTFDNGAGLATNHMLVLENVTISNEGSTTNYIGWMQKIGRLYVLGCDGIGGAESHLLGKFSSSTVKKGIVIGSKGQFARSLTYHMAGSECSDSAMGDDELGVNDQEPIKGRSVFHSFLTATATAPLDHDGEIGPDGLALVGSVLELSASTPSPLLPIGGTTTLGDQQNVLIQGNTLVGQRANMLYADTATSFKRGYIQNNIFTEYNTKSDVHSEDGTLTGNWAAIYKVGYRSNAYMTGGSNSDVFGAGEWLGEVAALGDVTGSNSVPIVADFVNDASFEGSGLGFGDYTPGAGTELQNIPANQTHYPIDLYGNVINMDGTAYVGSSQQASSASEDATATPGAGAVSGSGEVPAISAGAAASPVAGSADLLGLAPSVTSGSASAPVTGSSAGLGFAPLVSAGTSAAPAAGAVSALGWEPALAASSRSSPAVGTVAGAGFAPAATAGSASDAFPATGASLGGGFEPAISTGSAARPSRGSTGAAGFAPLVSANGNATAAPAAGSAEGSGLSPVTGTGVLIATGAGSAASGGFAPLVSANASSAPGAGAVVGLGFAPAALGLGAEDPDFVFAADSARTGTILNPRRDGK